jgi:methylglyoxal synthase
MNIALIANDNKKELMVDFCIAYKAILEKHNIYATGTTGALVSEGTGLFIHKLSPGPLGGGQHIRGMAEFNEIDLVIFLKDPLSNNIDEPDVTSLLHFCDLNSIPYATNIATAEMLIKGLERGDLDWRGLVR